MKAFLLVAVVAVCASFSAAVAEKVSVPVYDTIWKIDLAKACQKKPVTFVMKNGMEATMKVKNGQLHVNGVDSGIPCPVKVVKKRSSGGSGGGFTSNLEVAVHPDGSPVLNPGEVAVPVGNTNTGNTPVTGIGGTGPYTPVNDQPAPTPTVEPVDTSRPEEVSAGFGPINN